MTTEEKAKAYDEVLEKAKAHINSKGIGDTVDLCKNLFSELRESEDERIRKELVAFFKAIQDSPWQEKYWHDLEIVHILAYLEKQKEQKPAEWSEEDEDMLNSCISSIEEAKENRYAYKETDGDTSYDHEIAWLKLLRNRVGKEFLQPHWKPSEEQMGALKDASDREFFSGYGATLRVLYDDLKKLI